MKNVSYNGRTRNGADMNLQIMADYQKMVMLPRKKSQKNSKEQYEGTMWQKSW